MIVMYLTYILLTTIVACSNCVDEITFTNVTIGNYFKQEVVATISSSKSLKGYIPSGSFQQHFVIVGKIPVLWENSVADIDSLQHLSFWNNEIEEIRPGAFKNLPGIESIEINYNVQTLTILKEGVFDNLPVRQIKLFNNSIFKIEIGAFRNLPKIETLDLQRNKLETLDEHVFDDLNSLQQLDLSKNQISSLPDNIFRNLPNLKMIILLGNKFDHIPVEVFDNLPVEFLDLSFNSISSLPKGVFKNFPKRNIALSHNKITSVPEDVFNNLHLHQVKLDGNQISYIASNAFDDMPELANVFLSSNKLTEYNTNWFHNTPRIYRLHLDYNLFDAIPDQAFKNIYNEKKQWIKLNSNKIKIISSSAFKGLKKFDTLDLSKNQLENWNENILADTEVIYYLRLDGNQIRCVDGDFNQIFKANSTYLQGNPLSSDCVKKIEAWLAEDRLQKHHICHSTYYCLL